MEKAHLETNTQRFINWFCQKYEAGELDNESILEFYKVSGRYMNLATIADYAKREGISYPGAVLRIESGKVKTVDLFNVKFVIDNN